jgi:hypothetical protein
MVVPMVRPLSRGELYLMVTCLPLRLASAVAAGLARGFAEGWALSIFTPPLCAFMSGVAVVRRVQQAARARKRRCIRVSLSWVRIGAVGKGFLVLELMLNRVGVGCQPGAIVLG